MLYADNCRDSLDFDSIDFGFQALAFWPFRSRQSHCQKYVFVPFFGIDNFTMKMISYTGNPKKTGISVQSSF